MSMLAEPRSKQKWSQDPRNTTWSNDKTKFGYQLMTRMGWTDGKGLGANESGDTSHVTVANKRDNLGVGVKKGNDDNWIAHQDDFNALLGSLNQGKENVEGGSENESKISCLEDRVKNSKTKIMYHKFVKSKDLSRASTQDLACIFGKRSKSAPATPQLSDDEAVESDESSASTPPEEIKTTTNACNMNDYFAAKMASLRKAKESAATNVSASVTGQNLSGENCISNENKEQIDRVEENLENLEKLHKKKKKKKMAVSSTDVTDILCREKSPSNGESVPTTVSELTEMPEDNIIETNVVEIKPKKKKKKKRDRQEGNPAELCPSEPAICEENTEIVDEEVKAKKKKKRHRDQTDNGNETKKKKKKKSRVEEY